MAVPYTSPTSVMTTLPIDVTMSPCCFSFDYCHTAVQESQGHKIGKILTSVSSVPVSIPIKHGQGWKSEKDCKTQVGLSFKNDSSVAVCTKCDLDHSKHLHNNGCKYLLTICPYFKLLIKNSNNCLPDIFIFLNRKEKCLHEKRTSLLLLELGQIETVQRFEFCADLKCNCHSEMNIRYIETILHHCQENDTECYFDSVCTFFSDCFLNENLAATFVKILSETSLIMQKFIHLPFLVNTNYTGLIWTMISYLSTLPGQILFLTQIANNKRTLRYHRYHRPKKKKKSVEFNLKFLTNRDLNVFPFVKNLTLRIILLILILFRKVVFVLVKHTAFKLDKQDDDSYLEQAKTNQTSFQDCNRFYIPDLEKNLQVLQNSSNNENSIKNFSSSGEDIENTSNNGKIFSKATDFPNCDMDHSYLTSKTDLLNICGKRLKLRIYNWQNIPQHAFHQKLDVYPVFNQNRRPTLHNLMRYEIFRIGSFAYSKIATETNLWVSQLAQSGFYYVKESGRICCFSCGSVCEVTDEQTLERAHRHDCKQQEQNVPLHEWTEGLRQGDSHPYFSLFGNMTPTLFDDTEPALNDLTTTLDALNIESAAGSKVQNQISTRDTAFSEMPDASDHRQPQSFDLEHVHDPGYSEISSNVNSLPTNLNEVSSGLVIQESDESTTREVLTSASLEPMSMTHTPSQIVNIPETSGPEQNNSVTEEGAVGGQTSFDLGRASYPQFASSAARRATFTGWNPDHPQRPDELVAGGFFYAGYADCVRCFYCGLGLKYWRPSDIPTYQHARFRPNCVYNRMYKGQEYIDKVQQDLRAEQEMAQTNETNADNQVATEYTPETSVPDVTPLPPPPTPSSNNLEHEYMNLPASQEALRIGWRSEQIVQAVTNVIEDMGIVAQNVQLDILLDVLRELYSADDAPRTNVQNIPSRREEAINSSSIAEPSMASIRHPPPTHHPDGDELSKFKKTKHAAAAETFDGTAVVETPDGLADSQEQYHALERENAYLNQRTICTICQQRPVSCIYLPCGHVIACQTCASNELICRLCNRSIVATSNIYLS